MKNYTALILDRSGSMSMIRQEARNNFNEQLQEIKKNSKEKDIKTKATVVLFDSEVSFIRRNEKIKEIKEIEEREYFPSGTTALYDAIGMTITEFKKIYEDKMKKDNVSFLFVIVTDGLENCSRKFSLSEIKSEIEELEKTGKWTFTFVGTKDALSEANNIGIHTNNSFTMTASAQGMANYSATSTEAYRSYFTSLSKGDTTVSNFFEDKDKDEDKDEDKLKVEGE